MRIPVKFFALLNPPSEPAEPNSMYFVKPDGGGTVAVYVSDVDGVVYDAGNIEFITATIAAAVAAVVAAKADLASPEFTGVPTAPTPDAETNSTQIATTAFVIAVRDAILNAAPGVLDTLYELAAALGDDPNFSATMTALIATKVPQTRTVNGYALSANVALAKGDIGLGNVDNTADMNKPVSTAQAAADAAALASANAYADGLVVGLLDDRGNYDASGNTFPASGGSGAAGAIKKGDLWTISVAGTLGGSAVTAGDVVRAKSDTPGQTAGNWAITENNFGYVAENSANKDATGGYAGLTLFKINFKNALNTFTSFFTNANTAARTYTFQDRDGTIADDTDITSAKARANHTGSQLASTISNFATTVLGTALTGLSLATSQVVAATDTVVLAIGYLQAQITAYKDATLTFTNKRITRRVLSFATNAASYSINTDNYDVVHITAQTQTITGLTMSGTPVDGDQLRISVTGTTAVAFTLGTSFEDGAATKPTTTVGTARLDMLFYWNTETSKWRTMTSG